MIHPSCYPFSLIEQRLFLPAGQLVFVDAAMLAKRLLDSFVDPFERALFRLAIYIFPMADRDHP